jgi:hypothetical protein
LRRSFVPPHPPARREQPRLYDLVDRAHHHGEREHERRRGPGARLVERDDVPRGVAVREVPAGAEAHVHDRDSGDRALGTGLRGTCRARSAMAVLLHHGGHEHKLAVAFLSPSPRPGGRTMAGLGLGWWPGVAAHGPVCSSCDDAGASSPCPASTRPSQGCATSGGASACTHRNGTGSG